MNDREHFAGAYTTTWRRKGKEEKEGEKKGEWVDVGERGVEGETPYLRVVFHRENGEPSRM